MTASTAGMSGDAGSIGSGPMTQMTNWLQASGILSGDSTGRGSETMSTIHDDDFVRVRKGVTPHSGRRLRVASWGDGKRYVNLAVPSPAYSDNVLVYDREEVERIKRVRDRYAR